MSDADPNTPYYFESDHVALKDNADYCKLLHTIAVLEAQRHKATQDLEQLYQAQDEALSDPLKFVEKLQKGEKMDFALPQKVASLPEIQWDKYTSTASFTSFGTAWHKTRQKRNQEDVSKGDVQKLKSSLMGVGSSVGQGSGNESSSTSSSDVIVVRGRAKDSSKPASFNQLWTAQEQQKLESLLLKYPPEEVEARRWAKIATALGNRTPIQVASRVQKYFLSLAKEGLPVPGRMPNLNSISKKGTHRHHRFHRSYYPSSTLLQSHTPPVWMSEDSLENEEEQQTQNFSENGGHFSSMLPESSTGYTSDDDDPMFEGVTDQPEYRELMELQRLKREKLQEDNLVAVQHVGYKCDNCLAEPICGTRWHCIDCPPDLSYDFCDACSVLLFQDGKHDSTHRLKPIKNNTLDSDYISVKKPSYLDSNYMPST